MTKPSSSPGPATSGPVRPTERELRAKPGPALLAQFPHHMKLISSAFGEKKLELRTSCPSLVQSSDLRNLLFQPCTVQMGKCRGLPKVMHGGCGIAGLSVGLLRAGVLLRGLDGKAEGREVVQGWAG